MPLRLVEQSGNTARLSDRMLGPGPARSRLRLSCCALLLLAQIDTANADVYFGIKAGPMNVDIPARENPMNIAAHVGFRLENQHADLSLMGEFNRSVSRGETRGGGDLEFESEAIFLRVRTANSLFVSLRGGIVQDKVIVDGDSKSEQGILLGGGIGVVAGRTRIQLEYTSIAGDAEFLSLNIEF